MKQVESIKLGWNHFCWTFKTVSVEQFCQVYLRDNEEFFKLTKAESNILAVLWYTSNYYEDKDISLPECSIARHN